MAAVRRIVRATMLLVVGVAAYSAPAHAHPGHGPADFGSGLLHPFAGLDHLLAMVAVGLLAARVSGRGRWLLPGSFVGFMLAGALVGLAGHGPDVASIEWVIAASVLVFGLMVALLPRVPLTASALIVAAFALFHGYAHAVEMGHGSATMYMTGMLVGTAFLHSAGLFGGLALERVGEGRYIRAAGAAVAAAFLLVV
jgi:urease accessory protein